MKVAQDGSGTGGFARSPSAKKYFAPRDLRKAASNGDLEKLRSFVSQKPEYIHRKDKHGWNPLHMAVQGGHTQIVEYLVEVGSDYNSQTKDGKLPLGIAWDQLGEAHPITVFLRSVGAFRSPKEQQLLQEDAAVDAEVYDSYIEQGRSKLDKFFGGSEDEEEEEQEGDSDGGGEHHSEF